MSAMSRVLSMKPLSVADNTSQNEGPLSERSNSAVLRRQKFLAAKAALDEQENKDIENEELKIEKREMILAKQQNDLKH